MVEALALGVVAGLLAALLIIATVVTLDLYRPRLMAEIRLERRRQRKRRS